MTYTLHPDLSLGHVKLKISNMQRSVQFYKEIIGLDILEEKANETVLTADGSTPLIVLQEVQNARITPPRSHSGLYHYAILLPSRADLGVILKHLVQNGVEIGQADHLVSEALYLSDPDHNGIEIYRDRPREEWRYEDNGDIRMTTDPIDWQGLLQEAEGKAWAGMPAGTKIGHVHFHVSSLDQAKQFYCDLLGFDIVMDASRFMHALFVSAGGYHHHMGLNIWAGKGAPNVPPNGTGIAYFTIELPAAADVQHLIERLEAAGHAVEKTAEAHYVNDPFGIQVRIVALQP